MKSPHEQSPPRTIRRHSFRPGEAIPLIPLLNPLLTHFHASNDTSPSFSGAGSMSPVRNLHGLHIDAAPTLPWISRTISPGASPSLSDSGGTFDLVTCAMKDQTGTTKLPLVVAAVKRRKKRRVLSRYDLELPISPEKKVLVYPMQLGKARKLFGPGKGRAQKRAAAVRAPSRRISMPDVKDSYFKETVAEMMRNRLRVDNPLLGEPVERNLHMNSETLLQYVCAGAFAAK